MKGLRKIGITISPLEKLKKRILSENQLSKNNVAK